MLSIFLRIAFATVCCLIIYSLNLNNARFGYLLFGGLVSVTIFYEYLLFNSRKKLKDRLNKMRQQIASDLHDDVGSSLAALAMQTELFARANPDSDVNKLEKLQAISRLTMIRMRDIVWNMKPQQKNWGQLIERLQDHANQSLDLSDVDVVVKLSGINREQELSAKICKHFYLIGKEAITNISKHSDANQVALCFLKKGQSFEMVIQDNGSSKPYSNSYSSGIGFLNMEERARNLGAKLKIISNKGFSVMLQVTL